MERDFFPTIVAIEELWNPERFGMLDIFSYEVQRPPPMWGGDSTKKNHLKVVFELIDAKDPYTRNQNLCDVAWSRPRSLFIVASIMRRRIHQGLHFSPFKWHSTNYGIILF